MWYQSRHFITMVLGDQLPEPPRLMEKARHGPRSTLSTKKGNTSTFFKYSEIPYSCTLDCLDSAKAMIISDQRWYNSLLTDFCIKNEIRCAVGFTDHKVTYSFLDHFDEELFWSSIIEIVDGNKVAFVPKNALTERSIAIEPTLNLMLQLGVDGFIRKRLKRYGIDLDSQEKNQKLARFGSMEHGPESFCTIDLAAASDTISLWICQKLLPTEWYNYLLELRSPCGVLDDEKFTYSKISSMGNGYTFAIESLIFASLIYGVMKIDKVCEPVDFSQFACFGDDLIVKAKYVPALEQILFKSGFSINLEKSFTTGCVRESCGTDWVNGFNVRPVFLTGQPSSVKELWCDINRLQRNLDLRFGIDRKDSYTVRRMSKWIPLKFKKFKGPYSNTDMDTYLHVDFKSAGARFSFLKYAYVFKRLVSIPVQQHVNKRLKSLFMKLMHDLKPFVPDKFSWEGDKSGRRFIVTSRNRMTMAEIKGYTTKWCSGYAEPIPTDDTT